MNLKKCHQWLLQKQFIIKKDFVTAIGDIFTHVTAITDPWVGNGCHMSAHNLELITYQHGTFAKHNSNTVKLLDSEIAKQKLYSHHITVSVVIGKIFR